MPVKRDQDATTGTKLLRLFQRLMLDGRRHYQGELAEWLNCSRQTIIRLTTEIERVIGASLETGMDRHRRWYRMVPRSGPRLGPDLEELRYLRVCRDMAAPYLPGQVARRVDESILRLSLAMSDATATEKAALQKPRFAFFSKGRIDYTPYFPAIETLLRAQEKRRICVLRYRAAGSRLYKTHRFAVGRMLAMNNALYVLGADVREDFRTLRHFCNMAVHRIREVQLTDHPVLFTIPEADPGTFGLPWHEPRAFRIRFAPGKVADYVRERTWADAQRLEELADGGSSCTSPRAAGRSSSPGCAASARTPNFLRRGKIMFNRNKQTGPWSCAKCGSRNVVLRDPPCGITLLDKLRDLLGPLGDAPDNPARQWGAKRVVCKDCGHVSYIHVM